MSNRTIVLVTGATAGIGRHLALELVARGHHVIATGRNEAALARLAEEVPGGATLDTVVLDVTDAASIERATRDVDERTGGHGIDVLVNNAGYGIIAPTAEISDADLRSQFETNVFGLMAVTRAFLPAMRARGRGRIINVSSVGGRVTMPFFGGYNATKYAVESLSDALRREIAPFGIDVVLVEPGPIRTEFARKSVDLADAYKDGAYAAIYREADAMRARIEAASPGPDVVSSAIVHAIEARRPRVRYVVPFSSRLMLALMAILPTRLADAILRRVLGITPRRLLGSGASSTTPATA